MKKILIVDDHKIVVKGLTLILKNEIPDAIFFQAFKVEEVRELLETNSFDLSIIDLHMDNSNTLGLLRYIKELNPAIKIIIYSTYPEDIFALRTYKIGVQGYINKQEDLTLLAKAVKLVMNGEMFYSKRTKELILEQEKNGKEPLSFDKLSDRELEVAILLKNGKDLLDIENLLKVSKSTASTYKRRIFAKLNVSNVIELSELCTMNGI